MDFMSIYLRSLVRYMVIPCGIGFAAFAAIVLPGDGDNLSVTRLLVGASMMVVVPLAIDVPMLRYDKRRLENIKRGAAER